MLNVILACYAFSIILALVVFAIGNYIDYLDGEDIILMEVVRWSIIALIPVANLVATCIMVNVIIDSRFVREKMSLVLFKGKRN